MSRYRVGYRTPVAKGSAVVEADGIGSARREARDDVHRLTGHQAQRIAIETVTDAEGNPLWLAEDQPTPEEWNYADMGAR